ncbi:hypothetical protein HPB51_028683 [Rhipicephalus microplus]|uniref:Uncharacterized protein n=1 Tax=Rhipicephalus microplus TaxID=6941 RepID=A0A9J6CWN4_RHIMP|nr:hypothetical protein HPB51_028683 [Rhipicephalus microplus]
MLTPLSVMKPAHAWCPFFQDCGHPHRFPYLQRSVKWSGSFVATVSSRSVLPISKAQLFCWTEPTTRGRCSRCYRIRTLTCLPTMIRHSRCKKISRDPWRTSSVWFPPKESHLHRRNLSPTPPWRSKRYTCYILQRLRGMNGCRF